MYGNLRSKLDLQEENFPFSLPLKEKFSHNEVIFLPRLLVYKIAFRQRVLPLLGEHFAVTVFSSSFLKKRAMKFTYLLVN